MRHCGEKTASHKLQAASPKPQASPFTLHTSPFTLHRSLASRKPLEKIFFKKSLTF
jgi:hypothetical protein